MPNKEALLRTVPKIRSLHSQKWSLPPSSYIHVSVRIYIFSGSVCLLSCSKISRPILGIYKSLTDTWVDWTEATQFLSWEYIMGCSLQCTSAVHHRPFSKSLVYLKISQMERMLFAIHSVLLTKTDLWILPTVKKVVGSWHFLSVFRSPYWLSFFGKTTLRHCGGCMRD